MDAHVRVKWCICHDRVRRRTSWECMGHKCRGKSSLGIAGQICTCLQKPFRLCGPRCRSLAAAWRAEAPELEGASPLSVLQRRQGCLRLRFDASATHREVLSGRSAIMSGPGACQGAEEEPPCHVLLVEDDECTLRMVAAMLRHCDYKGAHDLPAPIVQSQAPSLVCYSLALDHGAHTRSV